MRSDLFWRYLAVAGFLLILALVVAGAVSAARDDCVRVKAPNGLTYCQ